MPSEDGGAGQQGSSLRRESPHASPLPEQSPRGSALGHYPWMVMLMPAQLNDEPAGSLPVHPGGGLGRKQGEQHRLKGDSKEKPGTPAPPGPGRLVKPARAEQTCGCCRQEGVTHPSQESFQA